jgi:hypothetical protein
MSNIEAESEALKALLREAKALAVRYYTLTGKPLGVTGEVAELEAAEKLGLTLTEVRTAYYDVISEDNGETQRYQIKGRAIDRRDPYKGRMSSINCDADFEWVLLVLLDRATYEALEIWRARREDVLVRLEAPGSKARNRRGSLGILQFRSIARKVWPVGGRAS